MATGPKPLRVRDVYLEGWRLCRPCLPRCLAWGGLYTILATAVLSPFVLWLSDTALGLSGSSVALNFDIQGAVLSLGGLLGLVVWTLGVAAIVQIGLGGQVLIVSDTDPEGPPSVRALARRTVRATPRLLGWALVRVTLLGIVVIPVLTLVLSTLHDLVVGSDENLLLSVLPAGTAAQLAAFVLLVLVALGAYAILIRWTFVLHALLLERKRLGDAIARSVELIGAKRALALRTLIGFHLGVLATFAVGSALFALLARLVFANTAADPAGGFVVIASIVLIGTGLVTIAASVTISAFGAATATVLYRRAGGVREPEPRSGPAPSRRFSLLGLVLLFAAAMALVLPRVAEIIETEIDMVGITAHRGSSGEAPENTMAAFRLALRDGAEWIELDVMEAGDGALVVVHDINLRRLTGVNRAVHEMTGDELTALDVGSHFNKKFADERMPTLRDVIELVRGKAKLNIELKTHGKERALAASTVDLIHAEDFRESCVVTSLDYGVLQAVRKIDPSIRLGAIVTAAIGNVHALDVDFYSVAANRATVDFIRRAHALDREVHVWTVNQKARLRLMMDRGVDNVITDYPARARALRDARDTADDVRGLLVRIFKR
ncbi:MAG: glycerophosphodiester phosphodiesterase [Planctomycetota bacterium]|nr:glycerophosphodiester phosphodiesterase [Planctomycetota bacterium]